MLSESTAGGVSAREFTIWTGVRAQHGNPLRTVCGVYHRATHRDSRGAGGDPTPNTAGQKPEHPNYDLLFSDKVLRITSGIILPKNQCCEDSTSRHPDSPGSRPPLRRGAALQTWRTRATLVDHRRRDIDSMSQPRNDFPGSYASQRTRVKLWHWPCLKR